MLSKKRSSRGSSWSSRIAPLGEWPRRHHRVWSIPLLELPFPGHTYEVVSMDYNFLANQAGVPAPEVEHETLRTLRHAFLASYFGNRAPLSIGMHFETWNAWAYDHAVARLLRSVCGLSVVRCVSYRELVDWLDSQPRGRLRRARAGKFQRIKPS